MKIKYTGTQANIQKIIDNLPGKTKAIRSLDKTIIIPTSKGAKQIFKGDIIVIDNENVSVIEGC